MTEEVWHSRKFSRNFTCSIMGLCVKRPPAIMSRHRSACMSIPKQKSHNNMLSGKDKSGLVCINAENLAQAAPIDSLHCSKSRIVLGRESIRDIGKNARWNLSLSSSQSPFVLSTACVYHCFIFPVREKENNFHFRVSCVMPEMLRREHISSNSCRWWQGFFIIMP